MIYKAKVYNRTARLHDTYLVSADSITEAKLELARRLDTETDEGAADWDVLAVYPDPEYL